MQLMQNQNNQIQTSQNINLTTNHQIKFLTRTGRARQMLGD